MGGRTRASRFAPKSASVDADDDDQVRACIGLVGRVASVVHTLIASRYTFLLQDEDYLASEIDDSDDDDSDTGTSDSDTDDDQEDPEDDDVLRARLAKSMAGEA